MNKTYVSLYSTLFLSMIETSSKNCLNIYQKLDLTLNDKLWFLNAVSIMLCKDGTLTKEMGDNIHNLYNKLLDDHKSKRVKIIENYNCFKELVNKTKLDGKYKLLFEDIAQREFGIYSKNLIPFYETAINDFYILHYDKFMDDIAFDFEVINYLVHPFMELDNNICADERFLKSLKYIVNLNHNYVDCEMYFKIKATLAYRETLIDNGFIKNIKIKNEHKKIVKRLGSKYDK